jgi:hypothetical protein
MTGFAQTNVRHHQLNPFQKKQIIAGKTTKSPDVIKQGLDSIVAATYKIVFDYDKKGNYILEVYYSLDEISKWKESAKTVREYDNNGYEIVYESYFWDENMNDWSLFIKEECEFNLKGKITWYIFSMWIDKELSTKYKDEYEYDSNGNESTITSYSWDFENNNWVKSFRGELEYYDDGKLKMYIDHEWNGSNWVEYYKIEHEYENEKNILWIMYDKVGNSWVKNAKGESEYDAHGNLTYHVVSSWSDDKWVVFQEEKKTYEYDEFGNITMRIYYFTHWETGILTPFTKDIYEFDDLGNTKMSESYWWSENLNNWVASSKYEYFFNTEGYLDRMLDYLDDNGFWVYNAQSLYNYDTKGNLFLSEYFVWENNSWVNSQKSEYDFDLTYSVSQLVVPDFYYYNNMLMVMKDYYWLETEWDVSISTFYWSSRDIEESISETNPPKASVAVYPNPVSDILHISIENADIIPDVKIYSIQGALLLQKQSNQIDVSSLQRGIYFAIVNAQCKKFVKQ